VRESLRGSVARYANGDLNCEFELLSMLGLMSDEY
jgi:hypothetical protein